MKVRVRSKNGGDTHRIEVPSPGSLNKLKELLAHKLSVDSSSIRVSLNKKDELQGPSDATLSFFGITSGDLVFYMLNPDGFSGNLIADKNTEAAKRGRDAEQSIQCRRELCAAAAMKRASVAKDVPPHTEISVPAQEEQPREPPPDVEVASMEIDEEIMPAKSRSVPFFLDRVLSEERGNAKGSHGLMIIAVHATLLESGFVRIDGTARASRDGFGLPAGWATKGTVSLSYTLPELVGVSAEAVVFKFQTLGKFLVVYGCLSNGNGLQIYRLSLEVAKFLPAPWHAAKSAGRACKWEDFFVKKGGLVEESEQEEKVGFSSPWDESNVFELWKLVKDQLSLPLLTALCEKAGLPPPPSLVVLPTELKLKVLEFLPAIDVAKMGCVCTEFRFLSANDELWKQKFDEEFGSPGGTESTIGSRRWKDAFARAWIEKKRLAERRRAMERPFWPLPLPVRRFPSPFAGPGFGISGGDYDRFPAIGGGGMLGGHPLGGYGGRHGFLSRRSVVPDCDLGGLRGEFGGRSDQGPGHMLEPGFDFGEG